MTATTTEATMTAQPSPNAPDEPADPRTFAALIAAVPIILVNALAVIGQCQWAGTHLHWGRPGQSLFAGALETTALAVMYLAHTALIEGDSAWRQKTFAYLIACGSASVNWQEHAAAWHPTPAAFVFAGASLLSPILWATYSRFAARSVMRGAGLIDRRAAKFSVARWAMFPCRTFAALRYSVWHSVQSPAAAIAGSQAGHGAPASHPATTPTAVDTPAAAPSPRGVTPPVLDDARDTVQPPAPPQGNGSVQDTNTRDSRRRVQSQDTRRVQPAVPSIDREADLAALRGEDTPWTELPAAEAIRRADTRLPGHQAGYVARLLADLGVNVNVDNVRKVRQRARKSGPVGGAESAPDAEPEAQAN